MLWLGALIFALLDFAFVAFLAWRIKPDTFKRLKWNLLVTTAAFWFVLWTSMSYFFWDPVYHYVFPEWARWFIPPVYGLLFGAVALLFWWLALRLPGHGLINFCILGGLLGMITHVWAIYRGILDKPPMLKGASPAAVTVMPFFEFIFYWCLIITISRLMWRGR